MEEVQRPPNRECGSFAAAHRRNTVSSSGGGITYCIINRTTRCREPRRLLRPTTASTWYDRVRSRTSALQFQLPCDPVLAERSKRPVVRLIGVHDRRAVYEGSRTANDGLGTAFPYAVPCYTGVSSPVVVSGGVDSGGGECGPLSSAAIRRSPGSEASVTSL